MAGVKQRRVRSSLCCGDVLVLGLAGWGGLLARILGRGSLSDGFSPLVKRHCGVLFKGPNLGCGRDFAVNGGGAALGGGSWSLAYSK